MNLHRDRHRRRRSPLPNGVSAHRVRSMLSRLLRRPELGAFGATIFVFLFFAVTAGDSGLFSVPGIANFLQVSAQLGILAAAVSLLMIGGEFDLSLGSMIGFAGIIIGIAWCSSGCRSGFRSPSPSLPLPWSVRPTAC